MADSLDSLKELSIEEHIMKGVDEEHKVDLMAREAEVTEGCLEESFLPTLRLPGYYEFSLHCDEEKAVIDESPTPYVVLSNFLIGPLQKGGKSPSYSCS